MTKPQKAETTESNARPPCRQDQIECQVHLPSLGQVTLSVDRPRVSIRTPRLADPTRMADFVMTVTS